MQQNCLNCERKEGKGNIYATLLVRLFLPWGSSSFNFSHKYKKKANLFAYILQIKNIPDFLNSFSILRVMIENRSLKNKRFLSNAKWFDMNHEKYHNDVKSLAETPFFDARYFYANAWLCFKIYKIHFRFQFYMFFISWR